MASKNFDATKDPRALETVLNLQDGSIYFLQNVDARATLRLRAAAVKPAASMRAHKIESGGDITFQPQAGISTWAWTDDSLCAVIITEAPG